MDTRIDYYQTCAGFDYMVEDNHELILFCQSCYAERSRLEYPNLEYVGLDLETNPYEAYFWYCGILVLCGIVGMIFVYTHLLRVIFCLEIALLGNILFFSYLHMASGEITCQIFALLIIVIAGVESAVGLSLYLALYRLAGSLSVESISTLRG